MGLFRTDDSTGFIHTHAGEVDRQLREGNGMNWPGDPRLSLSMGTLEAPRTMWSNRLNRIVRKGEILARRYEVWRHCEDGEDRIIKTYRLEEIDRIIFDLAPLRLDAPGHIDAIAEIDKHNEAKEKAVMDQLHESLMEGFEHALKLHHDTNEPKNVFRGLPGRRDEVSTTEQMSTVDESTV